ncbi:MAG TPA: flagellar hook-length control protein FliK [Campylobacterales bacterium]|nr:flagellar hook-length control protein FliK [Campylobacterales bacterium]
MSEQIVAQKTAVSKANGKTNPLAGLLKAGQTDIKDGKEFIKKLVEMAKKGEIELDKDGSVKIKKTQIKEEEIDATTLLSIKSLLSNIKQNDKTAIDKTVKELRDAAAKLDNKKDVGDTQALKKLLELAKDGGANVKKITVEKVETEADEEVTEAQSKKAKKAKTEAKPEIKIETKAVLEQNLAAQKSLAEKSEKAAKTDALIKTILDPKEIAKEIAKEAPKEATLTALLQEIKKDGKKDTDVKKELDAKKEAKKEALVKTETQKESAVVDAKLQTDTIIAAEIGAKKELTKEIIKEAITEELTSKTEQAQATLIEAPKQAEAELKGKMAVASEALKNFSSDMKEMIESYKPPVMKVSMELNPQNLGAVDVTLITRGQNLVVNVSSTQETMQMFMQNITEFKQNLAAQGFVSLQMNFNFSDSNKDQNSQSKGYQKEATRKYQISSEDMSLGSATADSLDIIMPHPKYA